MEAKVEIARKAALQLYADADEIKAAGVLKTGEEKFTGKRSGKIGELTITINPNGTKAAIEWKGRLSSRGTDYRIFRIEGYPTTEENIPVAAGHHP